MDVADQNSTTLSASTAEIPSGKSLPPSMIERLTLILDAFDGQAARITLEQVACRTRLPRSTVHRILDQLVTFGWVEHASFGYCLGRRALGGGGGEGSGLLREAAAPFLHELHHQTGMVVHLTVLDGPDVVYLDKVGGQFAAAIPSRVGGHAPAHCTAGGKAILAWVAPERVDALFGAVLSRGTENTITDINVLHQELSRIRRRRGVAFEREEAARGVACVAAAVRGYDNPVGSIALCGSNSSARLERLAPLVVHAVREISRSLYPESDHSRRPRKAPSVPADTFSAETMNRLLAVSPEDWT
ncbi:IclR family transcriptional regulator [Rhodococcus qingshengii]|uniref:IclR family transcriptional regulator n=1 Tax=Rhodococcus qingshengii TaxID=334542 RepID=UPI0002B7E413|nr:IclR family transcriptional regulator [Rhodococcus qingshengii BKS 20-40]